MSDGSFHIFIYFCFLKHSHTYKTCKNCLFDININNLLQTGPQNNEILYLCYINNYIDAV